MPVNLKVFFNLTGGLNFGEYYKKSVRKLIELAYFTLLYSMGENFLTASWDLRFLKYGLQNQFLVRLKEE